MPTSLLGRGFQRKRFSATLHGSYRHYQKNRLFRLGGDQHPRLLTSHSYSTPTVPRRCALKMVLTHTLSYLTYVHPHSLINLPLNVTSFKAKHSHASTSALAKMHHHAHGPKAKSRPCPVAPRDGRLKKMKNAAADDVLTNMLLGKPKPKLSSTLVAPSKLCEQHCHGFVEYEKCFGMCTRDNCRGMCKGLGNL